MVKKIHQARARAQQIRCCLAHHDSTRSRTASRSRLVLHKNLSHERQIEPNSHCEQRHRFACRDNLAHNWKIDARKQERCLITEVRSVAEVYAFSPLNKQAKTRLVLSRAALGRCCTSIKRDARNRSLMQSVCPYMSRNFANEFSAQFSARQSSPRC